MSNKQNNFGFFFLVVFSVWHPKPKKDIPFQHSEIAFYVFGNWRLILVSNRLSVLDLRSLILSLIVPFKIPYLRPHINVYALFHESFTLELNGLLFNTTTEQTIKTFQIENYCRCYENVCNSIELNLNRMHGTLLPYNRRVLMK